MKTPRNFYAILLLSIFLSGCLGPVLSPGTADNDTDFTPQKFNKSDFAKKIKQLTAITVAPATTAKEKAEAHRRLAILYLIPRNPDSDFRKSVSELGKFVEISPERLDCDAAASWATALGSGEEFQKMKEQIDKLNQKNQQLAKENKDLENTNSGFKKTIEELKALDLSLEKKRRTFR